MGKKIILIATVQSHICQFHLPVMKMLKETGWEVHVAAKNNLAEKNGLEMKYADKVFDVNFERSPFSVKNAAAYKRLKQILAREKYDVIQCNTPVGGVLARLAGKKYRKSGTKIVYISHGFHFYDGAPLKNRLIYYPIEKYFSRYTDVLVTINKNDYDAACGLYAKEVVYVPGMGIDVEKIKNDGFDRDDFRREQNIPSDAVILLSIGELNDNKNSEMIIRAIQLVKNKNVYCCFAGNGPMLDKFKALARELGVAEKIRFVGYRRDIANMMKSSDIFCLVSKREGLGLAALEAMACGLPLITSKSGGIVDYSEDGKTGFCYEYSDFRGMANGIDALAESKELRERMGEYNTHAVEKFDVSNSLYIFNGIYNGE